MKSYHPRPPGRDSRMLELLHQGREDQEPRWLPMQYPQGAYSLEQLLECAREYVKDSLVTQIRVLVHEAGNTWRVTHTITKTITETEH